MENYDNERREKLNSNKKIIIDYYSQSNNISELEDFLNEINNWDLKSNELNDIKEVVLKRLNNLKNNVDLKNVLDDAKKNNSNLDDFNIIKTDKDVNDRDYNGFRNDVNYLKVNIDGEDKLFEVNNEYVISIKNIIENENNKDLSSKEIYNLLKPYLKDLNKISINYDNNLDSDKIKDEVNSILDNKIREHFYNNIDIVLKERQLINDYINKNGLEKEKLDYSLNSRGERIYYLGDNLIKFNDNREMFILDKESDTFVKNNEEKVKQDSFDKYSDNNDDLRAIPENLYEYNDVYYINLLNNIFDKINMGINLNEYENELLVMFLKMCVIFDEEEIPLDLFEVYDKFIKNINDNEYLFSDEIREIFKKKKMMDENRRDLEKIEANKTLKLVNDSGFVDIILMCCSIILVIIVVLYIMLVKQ